MMKQVLTVTAMVSALALGAWGCSSDPGTSTGGTGGRTGGGGMSGGGSGGNGPSAACEMGPASPMAVISDFSSGTTAGVNPVQMRMGGWYIYYDGDGSNPAVPVNPGAAALSPPKGAGIPLDPMGGPCSGPKSLRQKAVGITGFGVGIGTNIAPPAPGGKHGTFDASAYSGMRVWMKCEAPTMHVNFKLPTQQTDFDSTMPACIGYSDCNAHGLYGKTIGTEWERVDIAFADILQNPAQVGTTPVPTFDKSKITALQIQIDANYDMGGVASPNDFNCWIDDVYFY